VFVFVCVCVCVCERERENEGEREREREGHNPRHGKLWLRNWRNRQGATPKAGVLAGVAWLGHRSMCREGCAGVGVTGEDRDRERTGERLRDGETDAQ
jgi:hypothetical protein